MKYKIQGGINIQRRLYTTSVDKKPLSVPVLTYKNAYLDKNSIIKENRKMSGVYM